MIQVANRAALYIENLSYRGGWYKFSIAYDPIIMSTSVYLHNFDINESRFICDKLLSEPLYPLTLHPMLVPALVFELLFKMCINELGRLLRSSIKIEHTMGLNNNQMFQHFKDFQLDNDAAAEKAFGFWRWPSPLCFGRTHGFFDNDGKETSLLF
jgi:hypothetical protein